MAVPQQRPRLVNAPRTVQVNRVMPGWESLETVSRLHGSAQIVGLILLVALAGLAAFAAYNLRKGVWPEWLDIGEFQIRSRFLEIACAVVLALLLVTEVVAYAYGRRASGPERHGGRDQRRADQAAQCRRAGAAQQARAGAAGNAEPVHQGKFRAAAEADRGREQGRRAAEAPDAEASVRRPAPVPDRGAAAVPRPEGRRSRRSSATTRSKVFAQDFVSVLEAAGWDHDGDAGVFAQQFPRDPIGVEVTLNEDDARGRQNSGRRRRADQRHPPARPRLRQHHLHGQRRSVRAGAAQGRQEAAEIAMAAAALSRSRSIFLQ